LPSSLASFPPGEPWVSLIEGVLRAHFLEQAQQRAHASDLQLINQSAEALNEEAGDVLRYQAGAEPGQERA